jgi:hypothetical protein
VASRSSTTRLRPTFWRREAASAFNERNEVLLRCKPWCRPGGLARRQLSRRRYDRILSLVGAEPPNGVILLP